MTDTHTRQVKDHRIRVLAESKSATCHLATWSARALLVDSTWTDESRCVEALEHPSNRVERRTHEVCEPVLTKTRNLRLDDVGFNFHRFSSSRSTVDRLNRRGHVQTEQLLVPVEVNREFGSSTENPSKENAGPMATTPPEGTSCSSRKCPQCPTGCTYLHTRPPSPQSCCGIAAKDLTTPVSRSQGT